MRKIDIVKINKILETKNIKQIDFADFIGMKKSTLSSALNGKRPFPIAYIFEASEFLKVNPKDLTICVNENISSIQDEKQLPMKKER